MKTNYDDGLEYAVSGRRILSDEADRARRKAKDRHERRHPRRKTQIELLMEKLNRTLG